MYEIDYGPKYDKTLDITDVAKRLRKEIREAVKAGDLPECKCSVRIQRFAGGQALDVTIKDFPRPILNRRWVELDYEMRKQSGKVDREQYKELVNERNHTERYSALVITTIKLLEDMVAQWNYDGSDSQIDYFNVNFYSHVQIDNDTSTEEWERVMAELKSADCGLRIFDPERVA